MSAPPPIGPDEAKRRALDMLGRLIADAKSGTATGGETPGLADVRKALGELRDLDPDVQRRIARAMVESRGDPAALRAAIEAAPAGDAQQRSASRPKPAPHPPTVVDARGGVPWLGIAVAVFAAAITAALIAGIGQ